jgi:hypothetical protein
MIQERVSRLTVSVIALGVVQNPRLQIAPHVVNLLTRRRNP